MENLVGCIIRFGIPLYIALYFFAFLVFFISKKCLISTEDIKTKIPPAVLTLLIAYAVFIKVDYYREKTKIDLLAQPCYDSLIIGNGYNECSKLVKLTSNYDQDEYLYQYGKNQIKKINSQVYSLVSQIPIFRRIGSSNTFVQEDFNDLNVGNVYNHMIHAYWGSRAKAIYLLLGVDHDLIARSDPNYGWDKILERLTTLVENDKYFPVQIMAKIAYEKIVNSEISSKNLKDDPFGFKAVKQHWVDNKPEILKRLETDNTLAIYK